MLDFFTMTRVLVTISQYFFLLMVWGRPSLNLFNTLGFINLKLPDNRVEEKLKNLEHILKLFSLLLTCWVKTRLDRTPKLRKTQVAISYHVADGVWLRTKFA